MDLFGQFQGILATRRWRMSWQGIAPRQWPEAIRPYLDACAAEIDLGARIPLLAIDLETTGLDADAHRLLSAGWVSVDDGVICGKTADHHWVQDSDADLRDTAAIHGILDSQSADVALGDMLAAFYKAAAGRALLAHHADIELNFIRAASLAVFGCVPPLLAVDSLRFCRAVLGDQQSLRLIDLRRQFGLPDYQNHHALSDAHAAAELWLVLQQKFPRAVVGPALISRPAHRHSTKVV